MHPWFAGPNWLDFHLLASQAALSSSRSNEPLPNALFDLIRLLVAPLKSRIPGPSLLLASLDWIVVFVTFWNRTMPSPFWEELVARMVLPVEKAISIPTSNWLTSVLRSTVLLLPPISMPTPVPVPSTELAVTTLLSAPKPSKIPKRFCSICSWFSLLLDDPETRTQYWVLKLEIVFLMSLLLLLSTSMPLKPWL